MFRVSFYVLRVLARSSRPFRLKASDSLAWIVRVTKLLRGIEGTIHACAEGTLSLALECREAIFIRLEYRKFHA